MVPGPAARPVARVEVFVDDAEIDAATALDLGLVNRVVPDDELTAAAFRWASGIAAGPRTAWAFFKENLRDALALDLREALRGESERMVRSGRTEDHREAVRTWLRDGAAARHEG